MKKIEIKLNIEELFYTLRGYNTQIKQTCDYIQTFWRGDEVDNHMKRLRELVDGRKRIKEKIEELETKGAYLQGEEMIQEDLIDQLEQSIEDLEE